MDLYIPDEIASIVEGKSYTIDDVGKSASDVILFDDMVLKITPKELEDEKTVEVMRWLEGRLPVPQVLAFTEEDGKYYLLMSRIPGEMSCRDGWLERPDELMTILADSLMLLSSVDIDGCPRVRDIDMMIAEAEDRIRNGLVDTDDWEPETYKEFGSPDDILSWLKANKPAYEPCLSHGDFCLPNIYIKDGSLSGFIDLGYTGVSDKWIDITLLHRSLRHNTDGFFGGKVYPDFRADDLFDKLGIEPDRQKMRWFLLLDELF